MEQQVAYNELCQLFRFLLVLSWTHQSDNWDVANCVAVAAGSFIVLFDDPDYCAACRSKIHLTKIKTMLYRGNNEAFMLKFIVILKRDDS